MKKYGNLRMNLCNNNVEANGDPNKEERIKFPEDNISMLSCQDTILLQLLSQAPQPRHTDPGVRRKSPRMDSSGENYTSKQV